jgi:CRP-like cAMP-binding protein
MTDQFKQHILKFVPLSDADFRAVSTYFRQTTVAKKETLLTEGQLCQQQYFVLRGCLRLFFINKKGVEQTTQFAIENWWLTDVMAFERRALSQFSIQAVEQSDILCIDNTSQERMLQQFPQMERYFRYVYQRAFAASQFRVKYIFDLSKEDFYHQFLDSHPGFAQRIPQYLLASFLGFTPEYLSELRSKRVS